MRPLPLQPDVRCRRIEGYTSIRAGKGLGDSLYLQGVVRHLVEQGRRMQVCSNWPDVFRPLSGSVIVSQFTRMSVDLCAHYSLRKPIVGTSQFEDCCIQAGIKGPVDFRLDWRIADEAFVESARRRAEGRPIVCVAMPRLPMARADGFALELAPDWAAMQRLLDTLSTRFCLVQLGAGSALHTFSGIDLDLANRTTVAQMLDVASIAHGFVGYCGLFVPLAESLKKPALLLWSRRGLRSRTAFIRQITPQKVLHGPWCRWAMDDWPHDRIDEEFHGVL